MDSAGHARITDLTLASITTDTNLAPRAPEDRSHSARWTAPEILNEEGTCSKKADVFSFAMVMIEVCFDRLLSAHLWITLRCRCSLV